MAKKKYPKATQEDLNKRMTPAEQKRTREAIEKQVDVFRSTRRGAVNNILINTRDSD